MLSKQQTIISSGNGGQNQVYEYIRNPTFNINEKNKIRAFMTTGRKIESLIDSIYAKQSQFVKRNAGQKSYIKAAIPSTYRWITEIFRFQMKVKNKPNLTYPKRGRTGASTIDEKITTQPMHLAWTQLSAYR